MQRDPGRRKKPTVGKGRKAEEKACRFLRKKGFRILARNYRCRSGEIDIVAEEKGDLIFVEVRSLGPSARHLPEETIDPEKQRRLSRTALAFLRDSKMQDRPARFDVVAVETTHTGTSLRHLPDAFELWEP